MTQERMTRLAYHGALTIWGHLNEIAETDPSNEAIKAKEQEAWKELQELHQMMPEIESKA